MVLTQQNIIQQVPHKPSFPLWAILNDTRRCFLLFKPSGISAESVLTVFSGTPDQIQGFPPPSSSNANDEINNR